jgi:hypothetical protein
LSNDDHEEQRPTLPSPPKTPSYTVPQRPDGWPNWLGRRPMTNADRVKIRQALDAGLPDGPLTAPGPFLCYLTIDGLDRTTDQRKLIRLRGRIHAAARVAAEGCHTTYHATDSAITITIGIQGPDAQERINQLRNTLAKLTAKHGWIVRVEPR